MIQKKSQLYIIICTTDNTEPIVFGAYTNKSIAWTKLKSIVHNECNQYTIDNPKNSNVEIIQDPIKNDTLDIQNQDGIFEKLSIVVTTIN